MKKIVSVFKAFSRQLNIKHVSAYASSVAFFMFLSLIPILLLLCAIIPYTPLTEANLLSVLVEILPDFIVPVSVNIVAELYDKSTAVISITAIATIWSAAKGILALIRGLNVINEVKETRNYVALRLEACFYTLILLIALVLTLVIMVFGKVLVDAVVEGFPQARYIMEFFLNIRFVISLTVLAIFFIVLYTWLPNKKVRFKTQIPGALFTSVVWSVFSWGFSFYVNRFSAFSIYGSLSTIIVVMIWMYTCMYIILLGAVINRFFLPANEYLWRKRVLRKESGRK